MASPPSASGSDERRADGEDVAASPSSTSNVTVDGQGHRSVRSDPDRSREDCSAIYRIFPQWDGCKASIHIGCAMTLAASEEVLKKSPPFCCPRTSLFSQRHTSEGISADGGCAVNGHTLIVCKFAHRFQKWNDDSDSEEESPRNEEAARALQQDADNLYSIRKASPELARLVPQPLGTSRSPTHGSKGLIMTHVGWALAESTFAFVLDLDEKGRKEILAAIRYVYQVLHRSGWVHGDVKEGHICVRFCHRVAGDGAAAGRDEEGSVDQETETQHDSVSHAKSSSNSPCESDRSDGAGRHKDFPRQACVIEKDRTLQIRLIDFSAAKRLSGSELAAACKQEMSEVDDLLEEFDEGLAEAWEMIRAAKKKAAEEEAAEKEAAIAPSPSPTS